MVHHEQLGEPEHTQQQALDVVSLANVISISQFATDRNLPNGRIDIPADREGAASANRRGTLAFYYYPDFVTGAMALVYTETDRASAQDETETWYTVGAAPDGGLLVCRSNEVNRSWSARLRVAVRAGQTDLTRTLQEASFAEEAELQLTLQPATRLEAEELLTLIQTALAGNGHEQPRAV